MINPITLYYLLQPYKIVNDADLPWAYQQSNPQGRPLHNDWTIPWLPSSLQPWGKIPRQWTAYKVPLPFKRIDVSAIQQWVPYDGRYPLVPDTQQKMDNYWYNDGKTQGDVMVPWILADQSPNSGPSTWAAWIDGKWIECFRQYTQTIFGRRLLISIGLRSDVTITVNADASIRSDWMCWYPEINITWTK